MPSSAHITRVTIRGVAQFVCDECGAVAHGDNFRQELEGLHEAARFVPGPHYMPNGWSSYTRDGRLVYCCPKCLHSSWLSNHGT